MLLLYLPLLPAILLGSAAVLLVVGGVIAGLMPHHQARGLSPAEQAACDALAAVLRQRGGLPPG